MPPTVQLDDVRSIPDMSITDAVNGRPNQPITVETWREFADTASETVPCIVDELWPEGSLGFIASAPKKGKTWLGLSLALAVATGTRYLDRYPVPQPRPVLYVALEGHRSSLTHRIACLMRGINIDPDQELENLQITYKPRGLNVADPVWANHLIETVDSQGIQLVIIDVLRAAALIKENSAEDFALLRSNLAPLLEQGRSLAFLHHFIKLSETSKERTPAERMSGSGAMYGALDVGIFITGSDQHARALRLDFEARDIAAPDELGIQLEGKGTGPNGGLTYRDTATWVATVTPEEDDIDVPAEDIRDWLIENGPNEKRIVAAVFEVSERTIERRYTRLQNLGVGVQKKPGKPTFLTPPTKGKTPDTDSTDTCRGSDVSQLNLSIHAETPPTRDTPDTDPLSVLKKRSEQGKMTPDTPDTLRVYPDPVGGRAHPAQDRPEFSDDDIPF